jgi:hypothetical protein
VGGRDRRPLIAVAAVFLLSRAAFAAVGVRFDMSPLRGSFAADPWQLLDTQLLQHHLITSVWHLNSQPPLFNLFCGALLKLPFAIQEPFASLGFLALGLMMVVCLYSVLVELRVPTWLALAVSTLVAVDPAYVLYENWLSYAYPTAAFLSLSALCLVRYVRHHRMRWGLGFFGAVATVALLNSSYQLVWVVVAGIVVAVAVRSRWRPALVAAAIPVLLVVGWVAKDAAQVGMFTSSSWVGMNFARTTLVTASPAELRSLVASHTLTPIAEVPPFSPVSAYAPRFARLTHTGVAAVDAPYKADLGTNFNNGIYAGVSSQYLHDDLAFIRARPRAYAINVVNAAKQWTVPPDEYQFVRSNRGHIATWANLFDRTVLARPSANPDPVVNTLVLTAGPPAAQLSYLIIVVDAIALLGSPFVAWWRRRTDPAGAATLAYLWVTTVYALVTTSLLELGENQRFDMELGPLPLIAAVVVVVAVARVLKAPVAPAGRAPATSPPAGTVGYTGTAG